MKNRLFFLLVFALNASSLESMSRLYTSRMGRFSHALRQGLTRSLRSVRPLAKCTQKLFSTGQTQAQFTRHKFSTKTSFYAKALTGVTAIGLVSKYFKDTKQSQEINLYEKQRKQFRETLLNKPWGKVSAKYIKDLETEESKIMSEFLGIVGLSREQWQKEKSAFLQRYLKEEIEEIIADEETPDIKQLPATILNQIQSLLKKNGIDPSQITLLLSSDRTTNRLWATRSYMAINLSFLNKFQKRSLKTQEALIMHEICHILNADSFTGECMRYALENRGIKEENLQVLEKYECFREKRANILAALADIDYAKELESYFAGMYYSCYYTRELEQLPQEMHQALNSNKYCKPQ